MFVSDVKYKSTESPLQDEMSYSDVENVAVNPEDTKIDVINFDQSSIEQSFDKGTRGNEGRSWTIAKVQVGYDVTRKGERSLVINGFKFTKSRDGTNNRTFWRCSRRECKATAVTVSDRVEHVRAIHAHDPPMAAEFFGSHEGVIQHCELQEVRFNTNPANMRPRYRRSNIAILKNNSDESLIEKNISNSTNDLLESNSLENQKANMVHMNLERVNVMPTVMLPNHQQKMCNSVKDHVREFILKNSSQLNSCPQNNGVSIAQFIISPSVQSPILYANNHSVPTLSNNSSTAFSFNPLHIRSLSNNGSDSISDISSHKSTPGMLNVASMSRLDSPLITGDSSSDTTTVSQLQIEQIIQMIQSTGSTIGHHPRNDRCTPSPCFRTPQFELVPRTCPDADLPSDTLGVPDVEPPSASPSKFIHWKKEKLRESELGDQFLSDRKRRYNECSTTTPTALDTRQLCSFLAKYRPVMTRQLIAVIQKLTSELCPEEAVAQEVFEKCTAIKSCLETLEKLHSLTIC